MDLVKITDLYDLTHSLAGEMLKRYTYPWEALADIPAIVREIGKSLPAELYEEKGEEIWIAKSAKVAPSATISGPCIIGEHAEIRPGAFIRGGVLIGAEAVLGNSCEAKNCILFDKAQVPHFNYVGDSILGYHAHMGAGAVTSNVKGDNRNIVVHGEKDYETGRRKFGAALGDHAEIGCNAVLNPGSVVGRNTQVYPLSSVRGVIPANSMVKGGRGVFPKEER